MTASDTYTLITIIGFAIFLLMGFWYSFYPWWP